MVPSRIECLHNAVLQETLPSLVTSLTVALARGAFVSPTGSTQASTQAAMRRLESTDASRTSRAMRVTSAFTASGAAISIPARRTMRDAVVPVLSRVQWCVRAISSCVLDVHHVENLGLNFASASDVM